MFLNTSLMSFDGKKHLCSSPLLIYLVLPGLHETDFHQLHNCNDQTGGIHSSRTRGPAGRTFAGKLLLLTTLYPDPERLLSRNGACCVSSQGETLPPTFFNNSISLQFLGIDLLICHPKLHKTLPQRMCPM